MLFRSVKHAINGETDKMVIFKRDEKANEYKIIYDLTDVNLVANAEKKVPLEWIKADNSGLTQEFVDYALPLIQGDYKAPLVDGLPRFVNLKKVLVAKK